jgi:hypothetical protein
MKLHVLHLDDALMRQCGFLQHCLASSAHHLDARDEGGRVRLWGRQQDLGILQARLRAQFANDDRAPRLCFMGSGDFHHVSALLVDAAAERLEKPFTVVHFDNHPDWVHYKGGLHCGSWVHRALQNSKVAKILTIGVCSNDLEHPDRKGANLKPMAEGRLEVFPYIHAPSRVRRFYGSGAGFHQDGNMLRWVTIDADGEDAFLERMLSRIGTADVYITVDKDVLAREDAETNWDQGRLRLPWLLDAIRAIAQRHKIVGADVTGDYSRPAYAGTPWRRMLAHAEIMLDQPCRRTIDLCNSTALNARSNLALLQVFRETMP